MTTKAHVDRMEIVSGAGVAARHERSCEPPMICPAGPVYSTMRVHFPRP